MGMISLLPYKLSGCIKNCPNHIISSVLRFPWIFPLLFAFPLYYSIFFRRNDIQWILFMEVFEKISGFIIVMSETPILKSSFDFLFLDDKSREDGTQNMQKPRFVNDFSRAQVRNIIRRWLGTGRFWKTKTISTCDFFAGMTRCRSCVHVKH